MKKLAIGLLVLVVFQWLGELGVLLFKLPIPGALLGMIFLLVLLSVNKSLLPWLETARSQLIRYIALLFVPITTGAFFLGPAINHDMPMIFAVLAIATVLAQYFMAIIIKSVNGADD